MIIIMTVGWFYEAQSQTTTLYFIRHAEKTNSSSNPELSEEGIQRALKWAAFFEKIPITVFYTTLTQRTQMTCSYIATTKQKEMIFYEASRFSIEEIYKKHLGQTILIVGHSNTIPKYINTFLGSEIYPLLDENNFGSLYTLKIEEGKVTHDLVVYN
jgi:2,3-bisphosphoglycerate-dependent phosphoglycerate mutase